MDQMWSINSQREKCIEQIVLMSLDIYLEDNHIKNTNTSQAYKQFKYKARVSYKNTGTFLLSFLKDERCL